MNTAVQSRNISRLVEMRRPDSKTDSKNFNKPCTSMVQVFSTSLQTEIEFKFLEGILDNTAGIMKWSADLENWEKIVIIESCGISAEEVMNTIRNTGIQCRELARQE
jgi:hypothetical protein